MRSIVLIEGVGLAVATEVGVWADRTLIAVTDNRLLSWLSSAEWTIAKNHGVAVEVAGRPSNRLGQRNKSVARVLEWGLRDARVAVVEIWAVHALVADASDVDVAVVAEGIMDGIASRTKS